MSEQKFILFLAVLALVIGIINLVILGALLLREGWVGESSEVPASFVSGEPVDWQNPEKPESSLPLEKVQISEEAIKIGVSETGFFPVSFEVKKGEKIFLAVTSEDEWTHVFKFADESLIEVAVGVAPGETRAITFYAPKEAGEYEFYCDVPGHEARGEKGKMIVK